jgi:hypothetical protein
MADKSYFLDEFGEYDEQATKAFHDGIAKAKQEREARLALHSERRAAKQKAQREEKIKLLSKLLKVPEENIPELITVLRAILFPW